MIAVFEVEKLQNNIEGEDPFEIMEENELLKLRKSMSAFTWLMDNVCREMVGRKTFDDNIAVKNVSAIVPPSHEAFALLIMENYREVIKERASDTDPKPRLKQGQKNKEYQEQGKYTCNGVGAKRNEGWSRAGFERFIWLIEHVTKDRSEDLQKNEKSTENIYKQEKKAKIPKMKKKRGQTSEEDGSQKRLKNPILMSWI